MDNPQKEKLKKKKTYLLASSSVKKLHSLSVPSGTDKKRPTRKRTQLGGRAEQKKKAERRGGRSERESAAPRKK